MPFDRLTYQEMSDGRPVSWKVTLYVYLVKFICSKTTEPLIVNDPEAGLGAYALFEELIVNE
jgi:hypothetical protein